MDGDAAPERLAALDAPAAWNEPGGLISLALHKLSGYRKYKWAMTVNGPWRICFRFEDGNARDVETVDCH